MQGRVFSVLASLMSVAPFCDDGVLTSAVVFGPAPVMLAAGLLVLLFSTLTVRGLNHIREYS
ncbi:hypothetical protein [Paenibacillus sp. P46E]|uniref:hypothetical protein n=1 Tax=Paenibacillus sp. P46E TaxID=1349436 RepID=UPI001161254D|nr:hypothetical protein [Paenibacillus sp. P46E]